MHAGRPTDTIATTRRVPIASTGCPQFRNVLRESLLSVEKNGRQSVNDLDTRGMYLKCNSEGFEI